MVMQADCNFVSGHLEADAHIEMLAMQMVIVRYFKDDPTRNEMREQHEEFSNHPADLRFQRLAGWHIADGDLHGPGHDELKVES
ncbi:hypothetical protein GALL_435540 [mine drainage metagenome]|uniref:Uncharacterized protein n=1 Tax=mine drainage metagenome TaxID=410659 RepID=A0A1J5PV94_9ZZZZ